MWIQFVIPILILGASLWLYFFMMNDLRKYLKSVLGKFIGKPLSIAFAEDYTLSESSTSWERGYCCSSCSNTVGVETMDAGICSSCGDHELSAKVYIGRHFWDGTQWMYQRKFGDGSVVEYPNTDMLDGFHTIYILSFIFLVIFLGGVPLGITLRAFGCVT